MENAGISGPSEVERQLRAALAERERLLRTHLIEKRKLEDRLESCRGEMAAYALQRRILLLVLQRFVGSPSWRVAAPLRSALQLIRPATLTKAELIHAPGMSQDERGTWMATGVLPSFTLPFPLLTGWVRIRLSIRTAAQSRAHLYFDTGSLFNEAESLDLGPIRGDTTREFYVHLPKPVQAFRFDPLRLPAEFVLDAFSVTPLHWLRADLTALAMHRAKPVPGTLGKCASLALHGRVGEAHREFQSILGHAQPHRPDDYALWRQNRALGAAQLQQQREWARSLVDPPMISVLVPAYNTDDRWLRACIGSVVEQTYPHWELCIADDGSTLASVRETVEALAKQEPRIRFVRLERNGGIAAASNAALGLARGTFVALLDHDDALEPHALHAVAKELVDRPDVDMLYSDEDKLSPGGECVEPFFKPDWSPDYFLSCMYTSHLSVYRASLVREVGGFRSAFDGSQDYDLAMRLTRRTTPARIRHIADVLYHWRMVPTSTAADPAAKPYAWDASLRAIADHLRESGLDAVVEPGPSYGLHHVRYLTSGDPLVSILISSACRPRPAEDGRPTYWARRCIESLRAQSTYPRTELIVIGPDAPPAELAEWLESVGARRLAYELPFNFSQACNVAAAVARGEHLLFLNDDTTVRSPDFIEQMVSLSQLREVGAVGARLTYPDGRLQHAGVVVLDGDPHHAFDRYLGNHTGHFGSSTLIRNWLAVTGAALMSRREPFDAVGGWDPSFPMNYGDTDYCLRLREAGYRSVVNPRAELVHHCSSTTEGHFPHESRRFKERWLARVPVDPYYNVNLSTRNPNFQL